MALSEQFELVAGLEESMKDMDAGCFYTQEEVKQRLEDSSQAYKKNLP